MEQCMFCLEEQTSENPVLPIDFKLYDSACECRISSHFGCWMTYVVHKGRTECPICHMVFQASSSPQTSHVQYYPQTQHIHVIYNPIETIPPELVYIPVQRHYPICENRTRIQKNMCIFMFALVVVLLTLYFLHR
jgi:hypothetical protein